MNFEGTKRTWSLLLAGGHSTFTKSDATVRQTRLYVQPFAFVLQVNEIIQQRVRRESERERERGGREIHTQNKRGRESRLQLALAAVAGEIVGCFSFISV